MPVLGERQRRNGLLRYRCQGERTQAAGGKGRLICLYSQPPMRFLGMFEICQRWERLCEDVTREEDQGLQRDLVWGSRSPSLYGQLDEQGKARMS